MPANARSRKQLAVAHSQCYKRKGLRAWVRVTNYHATFTRSALPCRMNDANDETDEALLERGKVLRGQAEELLRIAATIREQAQKLTDHAERTARILAANRAARVQ
jgi:hypothetical protein